MDARAELLRPAPAGLWLVGSGAGPAGHLLGQVTAAARAAEEEGLGGLWVDESPPTTRDGPRYEPYSLLGALAVGTERISLGAFPRAAGRRPPSVLAKIVTGVDVISHGRAVLTLAGDGTAGAAGVTRLDEALQVCRAVLCEERPEFAGRAYSVAGAVNRPAPVRAGGVPLVVAAGGGGEGFAAVCDVAGRRADAVVVAAADVATAVRRVRTVAADREPVPVIGLVRASAPVDGGIGAGALADAAAAVRGAGGAGVLVALDGPWTPRSVTAAARSATG